MDQRQNIDFVLRTIEERNVRFIRLWFADVIGRLKSFAISPEDLEVAFEEGIGFDGSSIEGFTSPEEADMLVFPDPTTFQIMPWRDKEQHTARIFCNIYTPDREPFAGDPRACLERVFRKAEEMGFLMNVGGKLAIARNGDHLAVAVFLISNTISVAAEFRKNENKIMRLIGATNFMIRAPFVVEGMMIGLVGAAIPLAAMYFLYLNTVEYVTEKFRLLSGLIRFLPVGQVYPEMAAISLALGGGLGFIVSFMTIRKHLRV